MGVGQRVLLAPVGTSGDVHPLVSLAPNLVRRGHEVILVTAEPFRALAERLGLGFRAIGTEHDFRAALEDPHIWNPRLAVYALARYLSRFMGESYQVLEELYEPGRTVCAATSLAFSARIAQERLGMPLATVHLQATVFPSSSDPPNLAMPFEDRMPRRIRQGALRIGEAMADRSFGPPINQLRAELGLAPVSRIWRDYWHSPQCVLCMFPDWFAEPQPDWPQQVTLCGFPLYDEADVTPLPAEVEGFLDQGPAPVVITPGTGNTQAAHFLQEALNGCRALGLRSILLTRHPQQLPPNLDGDTLAADYAPFGSLLPRAAAVIHHGGIGTLAQGLAAGIPQLIMPMAFDQPDNAKRLRRLGVGRGLAPFRFRARAVAQELGELISSQEVARTAQLLSSRMDPEAARERACREILGLMGTDGAVAPRWFGRASRGSTR